LGRGRGGRVGEGERGGQGGTEGRGRGGGREGRGSVARMGVGGV